MDNKHVELTLTQGKRDIVFYFPYKCLNKDVAFKPADVDLTPLDISVIVGNKEYVLSKYSIEYVPENEKLIDLIEKDVMHIAKLYSQFSYTTRRLVVPMTINDYMYQRFKNPRRNIEDAIRFLATLSSLSNFNTLNERIYNNFDFAESEDDEMEKLDVKARVMSILLDVAGDNDELLEKATQQIYEAVKDGKIKETKKDILAMFKDIVNKVEKETVNEIVDTTSSEDFSDSYTFQPGTNVSSYFFSDESIINIARMNNINISKAAARKISEQISGSKKITSLAEFEQVVLECINNHAVKVNQAKLNTALKMTLSKVGYSLSEISQNLIDKFYDYITDNIVYLPQSALDDLARNFYKEAPVENVTVVDSSSRLTFNEVINKTPNVELDLGYWHEHRDDDEESSPRSRYKISSIIDKIDEEVTFGQIKGILFKNGCGKLSYTDIEEIAKVANKIKESKDNAYRSKLCKALRETLVKDKNLNIYIVADVIDDICAL